jgi:hypothetical protein
MKKKRESTDYIELWVEEDGDTIICKRHGPGEQDGPADAIDFPPTQNLCYGINELDALKAELQTYGCDDAAIARAFRELHTEGYNEQVKVQ